MHPIIKQLSDRVVAMEQVQASPQLLRVSLKEILQDYVLAAIYADPVGQGMAFVGGTALRKLHGLPRFSEDLDFSCQYKVDFDHLGQIISSFFSQLGFTDLDYHIQDSGLVYRLTLRFTVLNQLGVSAHPDEKIHVKVEATDNVWLDAIRIPRSLGNYPSTIITYPLETLMAGKIAACLNRVFKKGDSHITIKGRDYFDLIWYLEKQILPNPQALTAYGLPSDLSTLLKELDNKVAQVKSNHIWQDLGSYVTDGVAAKLWCDHFHELYANASRYLRG